jgi:hypothetical protein
VVKSPTKAWQFASPWERRFIKVLRAINVMFFWWEKR